MTGRGPRSYAMPSFVVYYTLWVDTEKTHWVATGNGTISDPGRNILEEDIDDVFVASRL